MKKLLLIAAIFCLAGCGTEEVKFSSPEGCSVEDTEEGAKVVCDDGTVVPINDGVNGSDGEDGDNGYNSLISADRATLSASICPAESGVAIKVGLDTNFNNSLDSSEIQSTTFVCDGQDGQDGEDGQNANNSSYMIVDIADPCGDKPGHFDEVLLVTESEGVIAYFKENGSREFLTVLTPGNYRTTDKQKCNFTVHSDNSITW